MTISERIFEILKMNNMSQKQFATLTGISEAAISDWKKRGTNPSSEKILKICEVLGVTPNELLLGADSKNKAIKPIANDYAYEDETCHGIVIETWPKADRDGCFAYNVRVEKRINAYSRQFGKHLQLRQSKVSFYLNPSVSQFINQVNNLYVDKTGLLNKLNQRIENGNKFVCVSRPRRFGKTITGSMMTAYYSHRHDMKVVFDRMEISMSESYLKHMGKYNVLVLDMQGWETGITDNDAGIKAMEKRVIREFKMQYPNAFADVTDLAGVELAEAIERVYNESGKRFIIIMDEWDAIFRNDPDNKLEQEYYIRWLRHMYKNSSLQECYALVYMTGILPIKKYGTESALNHFEEISFVDASDCEPYTGFTEPEVRGLCDEFYINFEEMKCWYDGYVMKDGTHIFNPKSVVEAIAKKEFKSYWSQTGTYTTIEHYIRMNYDGLKDEITYLLGGGSVKVRIEFFQNDMNVIESKDDVYAVLCHLGYLAYDSKNKTCWIPNFEIRQQFEYAVEVSGWSNVTKSIKRSEELLEATLAGDTTKVAQMIDDAHMQYSSIIKYNDENSLSCVLSLAYYHANETYKIIREMPAGRGFADLVFLPRMGNEGPAMIVELKYDKSVQTALNQIKERKYMKVLDDYTGEVLLVGINYNETTKVHECLIERLEKMM